MKIYKSPEFINEIFFIKEDILYAFYRSRITPCCAPNGRGLKRTDLDKLIQEGTLIEMNEIDKILFDDIIQKCY